jgi:hypothetical protein
MKSKDSSASAPLLAWLGWLIEFLMKAKTKKGIKKRFQKSSALRLFVLEVLRTS